MGPAHLLESVNCSTLALKLSVGDCRILQNNRVGFESYWDNRVEARVIEDNGVEAKSVGCSGKAGNCCKYSSARYLYAGYTSL